MAGLADLLLRDIEISSRRHAQPEIAEQRRRLLSPANASTHARGRCASGIGRQTRRSHHKIMHRCPTIGVIMFKDVTRSVPRTDAAMVAAGSGESVAFYLLSEGSDLACTNWNVTGLSPGPIS